VERRRKNREHKVKEMKIIQEGTGHSRCLAEFNNLGRKHNFKKFKRSLSSPTSYQRLAIELS
jgi:hypothetical protein